MKTTVAKLPNSRVKINLEVPAKEIKPVVNEVYKHFAAHVEVTGFRPGKAPRAMVLERVGIGRIQQEVLSRLLQQRYAQVIAEHKLVPVAEPTIVIEQFEIASDGSGSSDLKAILEVDVLPKVTITGYKTIKVTVPKQPQPVGEADVEKVIEQLRRQKANLIDINRASQAGDWVDVSFKGSLSGVVQEKLQSDHLPVVIGSKTMVPGFEDQLIGLKKGDKKVFDLAFPSDYFAKEFSGKTVEFEVSINDLKKVELPAVDAAFVKQFGYEDETQFRAAVTQSVGVEHKRHHQSLVESHVIEAALQKCQTELPQALVESEINRMIERLKGEVERQNLPLAIYLEKVNKTLPELRVDFKPKAEHNVRVGLLLGEVVRQEGIDAKVEDAARQALDKLMEYATK